MSRLGSTPGWSWEDWMKKEECSGLVPFDLHIHDLDYLVYTLGEPENCITHRARFEDHDIINATYEFSDGRFVTCDSWWYNSGYPFTSGYRFTFEKAVMEYTNQGFTLYTDEGATPIKTDKGWLHIAHGVSNTAAGLRYVVYVFVTDLKEPWKVIAEPGGFLIAPRDWERVGDVSNVVFTNGAIARENGDVYIYYAASDTRLHVATTTVDKLLDYAFNTPADPLRSRDCVAQRCQLIDRNLEYLKK
jgi:hypothetical protein